MFRRDDEEQSHRSSLRKEFLEAFARSPESYPFRPVEDTYHRRADYYLTMQANVMAEAVSAFHSAGPVVLQCKSAHDELLVYRPISETREPDSSELQLKDNVVDFNGVLFWVTKCEAREVIRKGVKDVAAGLEGVSLQGSRLENAMMRVMDAPGRLKVRIFAGDYLVRYQCAVSLQVTPPLNQTLERMVLNPSRQEPGTYASSRALQEHLMPYNGDQETAVKSLRHRVELIHGPPGTGKSTTIFHVLSSRMPWGSASVVTCVTNQAIDAVAEKLAITHEAVNGMKILVLGNPNRVGKTAGKYTLDNLCKRDALVVSMKWAYNLLERVLKATEGLQLARQQRLYNPHRRSRFSMAYIEGLPSVRRYRMEVERDNLLRRRQALPVETYDPMKFYLDRLTSVKEKMAWVVVKSTAMRLRIQRDRFQHTTRLHSWRVEDFLERVRRCFRKAQEALNVAKATVERRVVRNTRVFLCTIPSSYQVRKLQEDFPDDFPARLAMCILDEAAATAETYVPLVISIGVENLVMLGDHKQLNPLVLAMGGDREVKDKNVDRSFMERAMACRCRLHPLRTQYRMPDVLCQLVSQMFYDGQLQSDLSSQFRGLRLASALPTSALRWVNVREPETEVGTSKVNCAEIKHIVTMLQSDRTFTSPREAVMIIALYKPHAALLEEAVRKFLPQRLDSGSVKVVTVDASQGSESPHIILSTVRSNGGNSIGFANNPRRLCVALSRAQKTLTVVGNAEVFEQSRPHWRQVTQYFRQQGALQRHELWISQPVKDFVDARAAQMVAARAPRNGEGRVDGQRGFGGAGGLGKGKGKGLGGKGKGLGGKGTGLVGSRRCMHFSRGFCRNGLACRFEHY